MPRPSKTRCGVSLQPIVTPRRTKNQTCVRPAVRRRKTQFSLHDIPTWREFEFTGQQNGESRDSGLLVGAKAVPSTGGSLSFLFCDACSLVLHFIPGIPPATQACNKGGHFLKKRKTERREVRWRRHSVALCPDSNKTARCRKIVCL